MTDHSILYYVHDPMCSWCYAFRPVWSELCAQLPENLELRYVLGGLARDSAEPMAEETRQMIQAAWHQIEENVPGTHFNFNFWKSCEPRRSTYPACRAVLLAREHEASLEIPMIEAIQDAYYQHAQNPSDTDTLVKLAEQLGLDRDTFAASLNAADTRARLVNELRFARSIGGNSFPSLFLQKRQTIHSVPLDYNDHRPMLRQILLAS